MVSDLQFIPGQSRLTYGAVRNLTLGMNAAPLAAVYWSARFSFPKM